VKALPRWPLYLIALPAAVAVWSGWVGLGQLCGFGLVHPLPGIDNGFTIDTSITLPVGVEAYGSYALAAWLSPGVPQSARQFAKWSAIGALGLGMLGQVAYHLLSAAHASRAPWPVVVLVSSLPVVVLGFGAALSHLLRGEHEAPQTVPEVSPESAPEPLPVSASVSARIPASGGAPESAPRSAPRVRAKPAPKRAVKATGVDPADLYATELAAGAVPSLRRIRADMHVGQDKAKQVQTQLTAAPAAPKAVPVAA
jgi:pyruvate/2-oxoglutarate dehydrogenase complex dihydrolipoamide acyltransferase (E2) component